MGTIVRETGLALRNCARIMAGVFVTDAQQSVPRRALELLSRLSWELPQTLGGLLTALVFTILHLYGGVRRVSFARGATVISTARSFGGAFTQGPFIIGDLHLEAGQANVLFQHEYGHCLQSRAMGWAYYPRVAVPSVLSLTPQHIHHPVEQDANRRAFAFFRGRGWDRKSNPLDSKRLADLRIAASWYDYAFWLLLPPLGPLAAGLIAARRYGQSGRSGDAGRNG